MMELTGNISTLRQVVGEVDEGWPDRFEAALEECSGLDSKDSSPHKCDESCDRQIRPSR